MQKHLDELENAISKASDELFNEASADALMNAGRVAYAKGSDCIPPDNLSKADRLSWVKGYDRAEHDNIREEEQNKKPKRTRPATRVERAERIDTVLKGEFTGGGVDYYQLQIDHPTTPKRKPYVVECNDIIEALEMNFAEGNVFKALWRSAAARKGKMKRGHDALYDAEKIVFFGLRLIEQVKLYLKR